MTTSRRRPCVVARCKCPWASSLPPASKLRSSSRRPPHLVRAPASLPAPIAQNATDNLYNTMGTFWRNVQMLIKFLIISIKPTLTAVLFPLKILKKQESKTEICLSKQKRHLTTSQPSCPITAVFLSFATSSRLRSSSFAASRCTSESTRWKNQVSL